MRRLLRKGTKWEWMEEGKTDFNNQKRKNTTQPCLAHYNGNIVNIVTAMWQKQKNGELKSIAIASRCLNDDEEKNFVGDL